MNSFFQKSVSFPNRVKRGIAYCTAHILRFALRLLGRKASSFPGSVAQKIYPGFLSDACFGREVVIVSGTNGKTTCSHVLAEMLRREKRAVVTNDSGANMEDGLISSLCEQSRELRKEDPVLVFEIDEAWLSRLSPRLKPGIIIVLNLFRDQLDRYGELTRTRELIREGIAAGGKDCRLVLCADDPLVSSLALDSKKQTLFFGMDLQAMSDYDPAKAHLSDAKSCPDCTGSLEYERVAYAHLGAYRCLRCGFCRPEPDLSFAPAGDGGASSQALFRTSEQEGSAAVGIPGGHNLYNISAAFLAALDLEIDFQEALSVLPELRPTSGRMESILFGEGGSANMILVKNPVAMEQAVQYAINQKNANRILFAINDSENDGRDLSWLWDIRFEERMPQLGEGLREIVCSGRRAEEMALRLYYAGIPEGMLRTIADIPEAVRYLQNQTREGECVYLLPNYTAMLKLQEELKSCRR